MIILLVLVTVTASIIIVNRLFSAANARVKYLLAAHCTTG
jgi:hypothetical protein